MKIFIIAQIFGLLGMAMNIVSYQAKKQKMVITVQLFGSLFFAVNMFLLHAVLGALLNLIGIFRAAVYANKDKFKNIKMFNMLFIALYMLSYAVAFCLLGKEMTFLNFLIEILPVLAMVVTTIGFSKTTAADIRRLTLISSPAWLIYNIVNFSLGGILCEVFSLVSVITAIFRLDVKKNAITKS